jgi:hypothetical protein
VAAWVWTALSCVSATSQAKLRITQFYLFHDDLVRGSLLLKFALIFRAPIGVSPGATSGTSVRACPKSRAPRPAECRDCLSANFTRLNAGSKPGPAVRSSFPGTGRTARPGGPQQVVRVEPQSLEGHYTCQTQYSILIQDI